MSNTENELRPAVVDARKVSETGNFIDVTCCPDVDECISALTEGVSNGSLANVANEFGSHISASGLCKLEVKVPK